MIIREKVVLTVSNPIPNDPKAVTEALISDLKIKEVRAIYPLIKAINSGRLTRNYTFYPAESLIGKNKVENPTGYASFVKPYGKPIIREHQAQKISSIFGGDEEADVPMGRVVFAGFRRRQEKIDGPATPPSKKYIPGTIEGDGSMYIVPAITDPEAIPRVLGGAYQTVSIGARVDNVWESISGQNIAELRRKQLELPPYERGQLYDGNLSYWRMGEVQGFELSFVNVPSDVYAGVVDPDIGVEGIRLLVAEKKKGTNKEFNFFDAKTAEKVNLELDESVWDESFFVDSAKVGQNIWWLNIGTKDMADSITTGSESVVTEAHPEPPKTESEEKVVEINKEMTINELSLAFSDETSPQIKNMVEALGTQLTDDLKKFASKMANGEVVKGVTISDLELFRSSQDLMTKVFNDWNEEAAILTISLYLEKGGQIELPLVENEQDMPLTLGQLYLLDEDDEEASKEAKLSTKARDALPDSAFCGPNRSFPVHDKAHAVAALRMIGRYKGEDKEKIRACIERKAKKFGVGGDDKESILIYPFVVENEENFVPLFTIRNAEEVDSFLKEFDTFAECYGLTETQKQEFPEKIKNSVDVFTELYPDSKDSFIELDRANLVHYILNSEQSDKRKELVTLVGLVRKNKLTKEQLNSAFEAYNVFGTAVLKKFLENTPDTVEETITSATTEEIPATQDETPSTSVETIPDPVAATEKTNDGNKTNKSVWLGLRTRPTKRSGKTMKNRN